MKSKGACWLAGLVVASALGFAPVVARAPKPAMNLPRDVRDLHEALADCLESRLDGWELVDYTTRLVNDKFTRYSIWHLWENSGQAFKNSRGFSEQYNLALARILSGLGFNVQAVHAGHVRFDPERPGTSTWRNGHTWVRVSYQGDTRDVCASRAGHRAGRVSFTALSDVRPVRIWTGAVIRLGFAGPLCFEVWKSWLSGHPVPRWVFRGFHDRG
ncbi:hypothetical protein [Brooklawnia sp.]|uniref:hypothetical protein n=1 Tax=Brooklawnia sp. TaxID=2699740 RepID=UPI00311E9FD0